jgi:TRAP-type C4-dicarboxylate transport system substrate-binding protein
MKTRKASLIGAIAAACAGLLLQLPAHAAAIEINIATAYASDNFQTVNLQTFADEVRVATKGKIAMRIHPAGTLIKPAEIYAGVREGRAEGGEVIMSSLANEYPLFGMDALPFIVSGYDDAKNMWDASRPAIEKALSDRGLQLLYAVPWPPQNLYSSVPINSVAEFKGLRMRTYNPASKRIAELIRAKPVTIQVVDLEKAIVGGQLDLMLTSSWTGVETKAWQRMKHYYKVTAWIPKNIVFINKAIFDKLDEDSRQQLHRAAAVAEKRGWAMSRSSDDEYEAQLTARKVNVSTMEFFLRQYLDRIGETLAREWLKSAGSEELKVLLQYTANRSLDHRAAR